MAPDWQSLVGTPYLRGGRDPACGLDCWGLVRLLVPSAPDPEYRRRDEGLLLLAHRLHEWSEASTPAVGDVVVMGEPPKHVGVVVGGRLVLHATSTHGVIAERLAVLRQRYARLRFMRGPAA